MKINILQRGGFKDNHTVLAKATEYYCKMLMSTRMCNTLNIRLEIRATTLKKNVTGTCQTDPIGSKTNTDFTIVLKRGEPLLDQLRTLAHEIVHVHQKRTNLLQYRLWKSDMKYHARWNGEEMGIYDSIPYAKRPWEIEAAVLAPLMQKVYLMHDKSRPDLEEKAKKKFDKVQNLLSSERKEKYKSFIFKDAKGCEVTL